MTQQISPLHVDWLRIGTVPLLHTAGSVGLSTCPGRPNSEDRFPADLAELKRLKVSTVLTLVDEEEMARYGVTELAAGLASSSIGQIYYPMLDGYPPSDLQSARGICCKLLGLLGEGERILVHCIGGWGRSGTMAACLLIHEGHSPQRAIYLVRHARSPNCVESIAQEVFVHRYWREGRGFQRRFHFLERGAAFEAISGARGHRILTLEAALFQDVTTENLPRVLIQLHQKAKALDLVALSGEVNLADSTTHRHRPVDRVHQIFDGGLAPIPFSALVGF